MQQEAARKLGFNTQRTMRTAQNLYEGMETDEGTVGLITYMRTDSVSLANEAVNEIRELIAQRPDLLPERVAVVARLAALEAGGRRRDRRDCRGLDGARRRENDPEGESALTRLLVRPLGKPVLAQRMSTFGEPLEIAAAVEPDVYAVLVQGAGGRRSYHLLVSVVPPGAPPGSGCPGAEDSEPR